MLAAPSSGAVMAASEVGTAFFTTPGAPPERVEALRGQPLVVAGDFNIAPEDVDVYSPAAFRHSTHVTPEERGRLRAE